MKLKPSLDWLLIFVPLAMLLRFWPGGISPTALFVCSALGIIPVAGWIGRATEALAARVGEGLGALLNATFGNAAELIIAGIALSKGLTNVVKASITGSIIGNVLLVLGLSIANAAAPNIKNSVSTAPQRPASVISLSLAAIGLIIPTIFHRAAAPPAPGGWSPLVEQKLSLGIAVVMFLTYFCMLGFSLRTHKYLFRGAEQHEETERQWSRSKAVIILLIATAFVALLSEFLVGTIESVRDSVGLTEVFVGVIVVAIVGNAAEHSTAILMAMKNKMDLSVGIAIGSSLQIALFVAPVLIFLSYAFGRPMDLEFTLPEVVAVVVSVYVLFQISSDGETNWIEGIQLLSLYLILGILFFYLPEPAHTAP